MASTLLQSYLKNWSPTLEIPTFVSCVKVIGVKMAHLLFLIVFTYSVQSILHEILEFLLNEEDNTQFVALLNTLNDLLESSSSLDFR